MSTRYFTSRRLVGLILLLILPPLVWFAPTPEGLSTVGQRTIAVTLVAVILWLSELIRPEMTGLLVMVLFPTLGLAPPEKSFGGFLTSSVWLAFSGFVIGAGVLKSGLGERISKMVIKLFGASYVSNVVGLSAMGCLLIFAMPTGVARVSIMIPVAITVGRAMGYPPYSRGMAGLTLSAIFSTTYTGLAMLTGGLPAITLLGVIESLLKIHISWAEYLFWMFPAFGLTILLSVIISTIVLFKPKDQLEQKRREPVQQPFSSMTIDEKKMLLYLVAALVLWATDFLHGVRAAWVGLLVAIIMIFPRIGVLKFEELNSKVNFLSLFYIAGAIGLGSVLEFAGFSSWAVKLLFQNFHLAGLGPFERAFAVTVLSFASLFLTASVLGAVAVMSPILIGEASAGGLNPLGLLLLQMPVANMSLFPYQVIPVTIGYGYNVFTTGQAMKTMLMIAALTLILVIPATVFYWIMIGLWS
ncbi:MAG: anion permease [Thaumarchaeota archaeon]|nr:anion permease [Nitrososphaerota archaeon]